MIPGAVIHNTHVSSPTHGFATRRATSNTSAPHSPSSNTGMSPGSPSQIPGHKTAARARADTSA